MFQQDYQAQMPQMPQQFPLSHDFQNILFKVLLEDREFSSGVAQHVQAVHFSSPALQWAWSQAVAYRARYAALPSLQWLQSVAEQTPEHTRPLLMAGLEAVRETPVVDAQALKESTVDFLKRGIFRHGFSQVRNLFSSGAVEEAYNLNRELMRSLDGVTLLDSNGAWYAETYADRQVARESISRVGKFIGTGFPDLDKLLGGGASKGFLGLWIARPKKGKTTILMNHGAVAMRVYRKNVFHAVLEGGRSYVEDRYDALLMGELYARLRHGGVDPEKYSRGFVEAQRLKRRCWIQDYSKSDTTVFHIRADLDKLAQRGWRPDLIVVDYADLMRGRRGNYKSETEQQKDAFQDLKQLANEGYAIWTASQVQRPGKSEDDEDDPGILHARDVADCYAKVRIADFIGSLNQTKLERQQGIMRLYADLFRDGPANQEMVISADFERMQFGARSVQVPVGIPPAPGQAASKSLLYGNSFTQTTMTRR